MWQEVGDNIFRKRYASLDLNVGVILGDDAAAVIDTRASHKQARELRDDLHQLTHLPVHWVVNTHYHWDHCWGNALFPDAQIWGHERCRIALVDRGETARDAVLEMFPQENHEEVREVEIVPPDRTFGIHHALDVGSRVVEMRHLGLGHTDSDIVISAGDVVFAGDLIEEGNPPSFGDSYPLDWPTTLTEMIPLVEGVVVPGHGDVVDRAFIETQRSELVAVLSTARAAFLGNEDPEKVNVSGCPYPEETMRSVLRRAYAQMKSDQ